MQLPTRPFLLPTVVLACLCLTNSASAVFPPPIKDDGKFFSAEGLDKANKKIRALYENYRKDVVVETFATLPTDLAKKYDEKNRNVFFRDWAKARMKELGVTGVYILVCKEPQFLVVEPDDSTRKRGFSGTDFKKTFQGLVSGFKESKFDVGLFNALDAIEGAYKSNLK